MVFAPARPAEAVKIDPNNDIHCSVLSFYFHGLAKHDGAPEKHVSATKGLQDWYAMKMRSAEGGRYLKPVVMQSEIEPILQAVKADPHSMRDAAKACAVRAVADPSFNSFASSYVRP